MLTIVGGAMRSYLQHHAELPGTSLIANTPVNARTEAEKGVGGNMVAAMTMSLRSDIADPAERLRLVHDGAVQSKAYLNAVGARLMTDWSNRMPAQVTALGFRAVTRAGLLARGKPVVHTIVTNVPGPQVPLYMAGARIMRNYGLGPCMDGIGLFQVVHSYNGMLGLSFQACREMVPDPQFYESCLRESWDELRAAMLPPKSVSRPKRDAAKRPGAKTRSAPKRRSTRGRA